MKRLTLAMLSLALVSACSDASNRRAQVDDNLTRPLEVARVDTSQQLAPIEHQVAQPAAEPAVQPKPKPKPARRQPTRAAVPVAAPPPAAEDSSSAQGYAPPTPGDSAPVADTTALTAAADSLPETVATADTAVPPARDAATSPDTASTPGTDTMVGRDPVPRAATTSAVPAAGAQTLPIGTEIHAALDDSINSRTDTAGRVVTAVVMENITGSDGKTLIAAGAPVHFTVTRLSAARSKTAQGRLSLQVEGIGVGGELRKISADVKPVPHELRGRGVTAGDAAKVGVGAAGGAVLGRVIGGNTKGAVIGGVVGAAGGAVVASQTADRDVVVKARTPVTFVLTEPLVAR